MNDRQLIGISTVVSLQGQILFISTLEETVRDAEFVFEVVPEDLKIKQELFQSMACTLPVISQ